MRGLRGSVTLLINLIANGIFPAEIAAEYPYLEAEDVQQALQCATWLA
ncbi:MAG: DUF433 domain-containing protein [Acidobacteriota bacterium]